MRRAAVLGAMACVGGCVTSDRDSVRAAPAESAEPGVAVTPRDDLGAAVRSMDAPEAPSATPASDSADRWKFSVSPFLWAAGVTVTTTSNGRSQLSDAGFGELLFDLKGALMLHAEARRGRFFAFGEIVWFDLAADVNDIQPPPGSGIRVEGELEISQTLAMLAAGWRFLEAPLDCDCPERKLALEAYGGARRTTGRVGVDAQLTAQGGATRTIAGDITPGWWDPVLGMRAGARVTEAIELTTRMEVGGFGIGAERAVLFKLGADCLLSESTSLEVGWLVYASHYEQGGDVDPIVLKEKLSGPYFALTFRF